MKRKQIKAVFIDTETKDIYPIKFKDELPTIYELLKCSTITIVNRDFGGKRFDVICDDEGLFKPLNTPAIATLDKHGECLEIIVGNCIIAKHDDEGYTESLTDAEIIALLTSAVKFKGTGQLGLIASF